MMRNGHDFSERYPAVANAVNRRCPPAVTEAHFYADLPVVTKDVLAAIKALK
jgi:hypothetical protein